MAKSKHPGGVNPESKLHGDKTWQWWQRQGIPKSKWPPEVVARRNEWSAKTGPRKWRTGERYMPAHSNRFSIKP